MFYCVGCAGDYALEHNVSLSAVDYALILDGLSYVCEWACIKDLMPLVVTGDIYAITYMYGEYCYCMSHIRVLDRVFIAREDSRGKQFRFGMDLSFSYVDDLCYFDGKRFKLGFKALVMSFCYTSRSLGDLDRLNLCLDSGKGYHYVSFLYDRVLGKAAGLELDGKAVYIVDGYLACWKEIQGLNAKRELLGKVGRVY